MNLHVMRGPSSGDEVGSTIAVAVGGQGVLAGHAAVVDGVAFEGQKGRVWLGGEDEDAGTARHGRARLGRIA